MSMSQSKKPFEHYLAFLENDLGYQFFEYQKALMRQVYEGKRCYYCCNRYSDNHWIYEGICRLKEEMERDDGYLHWLYKPDGYTTDIVIYDELEKEN